MTTRPCGCDREHHCEESTRLRLLARLAWRTGGLAAFCEALERWTEHRLGREEVT
jgi:hypothetical protein